jgi:hypothetical protein
MSQRRRQRDAERPNLLFAIDPDALELVARYCGWSLGSLRTCARRLAHVKGKDTVLRVVARVIEYQKMDTVAAVQYVPEGPERNELTSITREGNNARLFRIFFNNPYVAVQTLEDSVGLAVCVSKELRDRRQRKVEQLRRRRVELIGLNMEARNLGLRVDGAVRGVSLDAGVERVNQAMNDLIEQGHSKMCRRVRNVLLHMSLVVVADIAPSEDTDASMDILTRIRLVDACLEEVARLDCHQVPTNVNLPLPIIFDDVATIQTDIVQTHSLLSKAVAYGDPRMVAILVTKHKMNINAPLTRINSLPTTPFDLAKRMQDADRKIVDTFTPDTPSEYAHRVSCRLQRRNEIVSVMRGSRRSA